MDPVSLGLAGGSAIVGGIGNLVNRIRGKTPEEEEPEVPSDMVEAYQLYKTLDNMEDIEDALAGVTAAVGRLEMQQMGYAYPGVSPGYVPPGFVPPGFVPPGGYYPPRVPPQGLHPGGYYPIGLPPQSFPAGQAAHPAWQPLYAGPAQPAYAPQLPGHPGTTLQPQPGPLPPQHASPLQPQPAGAQQLQANKQRGGRNNNGGNKGGKNRKGNRGRGAGEHRQSQQQDYHSELQPPAQSQELRIEHGPLTPQGVVGARPAPEVLQGSSDIHAPVSEAPLMSENIPENVRGGAATGHVYPPGAVTEGAAELAVLACAGNARKLPDSPEFNVFSERLRDMSGADTDQTIIIVGATPMERIVLMWSSLSRRQAPLDAPGTELPCGDSGQLALGGSVGMSITRADKEGHALVQRRLAQPIDCERLLFQAVEPQNCRFSRTFDSRPQEYQALVAPVGVGGAPGSLKEPHAIPVEASPAPNVKGSEKKTNQKKQRNKKKMEEGAQDKGG